MSPDLDLPPPLAKAVQRFEQVTDPRRRYEYLLWFAQQLPPFPEDQKQPQHKVQGCTSQVYITATLASGRIYFQGDADAQLTKGLLGLLINGFNGQSPRAILQISPDFIQRTRLNVSLTPSRVNGFYNIFNTLKSKANEYLAAVETGVG